MEILKFPSVYRMAKKGEIQDGYSVKVAGKDYVVGERAIEGGVGIRDVESLVESYSYLVAEAMKRSSFKVGAVSVSLPVEVFRLDVRQGRERIKRISSLIREQVEGVLSVSVFPQSITGFAYSVYVGEAEKKPTIVIDGGFNTINVSLIEPDGEDYRVPFAISLMDAGVRKLLNTYFKDAIREIYPDLPTDEQLLNQLFLKGRARIGGKVVNAEEAVREAKEKYLASFLPKVENAISSNALFVDYEQVLVIGGISYYLDKEAVADTDFAEGTEVVIPSDKGEYYNVLGQKVMEPESLAVDGGFGHTKVCISL